MEVFLHNFANLETLREGWPILASGLWMTFKLVLVIVPLSVMAGLIVAILQGLGLRWLNAVLIVYVDLLHAISPLVLLILFYYGLPLLGLRLGEKQAADFTLVIKEGSTDTRGRARISSMKRSRSSMGFPGAG